jgi:hypothetical protein
MASTCRECGESFAPARSDAAYCSSPCRQRAYRSRNAPLVTARRPGVDLDRPVPIADDDWSRNRFEGRHGKVVRIVDRGTSGSRECVGFDTAHKDHTAQILEDYVYTVASIAEKADADCDYTYEVDEPLPGELPEDITPEHADVLASWLEPALDRAAELLALLQRRSRETWAHAGSG